MQSLTPRMGSEDLRAYVAAQPDDVNISPAEFAALLSCSVRHIDRLVARGTAPRQINGLGKQVRRWRLGTVRAWLRAQAS